MKTRTKAMLSFALLTAGMGAFSESIHAECEPGLVITGTQISGELGVAVSGAGDVNNDGFDDMIVGAYKDGTSALFAGRVFVYSGKTNAILFSFTGENLADLFGVAVSGAGDVDNDEYADLIVGAVASAFAGPQTGRAYVYSGKTGALIYTFTGEATMDRFGSSVSGAGDVNNDGYADIIVGAEGNDAVANLSGRAYVYSGKTGVLLYTFSGVSIGNQLGGSVSGAGDVNGDGYADVIVGAYNNAGINGAGLANVYSGKTGEVLYAFDGESNQDHFGFSVSGAGDVNKDGFADLIVGAKWNGSWGPFAGRAYVYSGQNGELMYTFTGELAKDQFGYSVSGAGDVNFDGFPDVVVGAPFHPVAGQAVGRAYVYSGENGELLRTMNGELTGGAFGYSVSTAGDVNDNGYSNLIIGAPFSDAVSSASSGGTSVGRAYVYVLCGICCDTRGDFNHDGSFNIADITDGISWIFTGGAGPACQDESDANGDNSFTIADITYGITRIFTGGPAPICGTNGF